MEYKTEKMSKTTNFNSSWLSDPKFSGWLGKHPSSLHKARCILCCKDIDLGNMGKGALRSHADGAKHKAKEKHTLKIKEEQMPLTNFVTVKDEHKTVKLTSGTDENANIVQTSEDSMTHTEVKQNSDNIPT